MDCSCTPIWALASAGWRTMSTPLRRTVPDRGRRNPSMALSVVVLPAPFGPRRPKISLRRISKLTRSTATFDP